MLHVVLASVHELFLLSCLLVSLLCFPLFLCLLSVQSSEEVPLEQGLVRQPPRPALQQVLLEEVLPALLLLFLPSLPSLSSFSSSPSSLLTTKYKHKHPVMTTL